MPRAFSGIGPRLAGLTLCAIAVRAAWLMRSPEPSGWDGYYYVAQAQHLLHDGRFHVADFSWVLYLLCLPHLLGLDAVLGIKLVAALLAGLCVPAAWLLGRRLGDERTAWWLALWAAGSPALTHLAGDFPKNLGVAAPLLLGIALVERPWVAAALGALAGWAHRLGLVLAFAAASSRRWWIAVAMLAALISVVLWPGNWPRVREALGPSWPLAPWAYFSMRATSWPEAIELSLAWPALIVSFKRWRSPFTAALWLPLLICAVPFWRTDSLDLGYRLGLMAPLFAMPLLVASVPRLPRAIWALPLAVLAVTGFDPHATPDYARYRKLIAKIPRPLPELLIAHQGINFLYDVETGHEAMAWAPEPELDRTHVFRLAYGVRDGEWLQYAPDADALRLDDDYVYVREDAWERLVTAARTAHDDELEERLAGHQNPSKLRAEGLGARPK